MVWVFYQDNHREFIYFLMFICKNCLFIEKELALLNIFCFPFYIEKGVVILCIMVMI